MEVSLSKSLDLQLEEFRKKRFIAVPLAGLITWLIIGVAGAILPEHQAMWVLFIATGMTTYLGMFLSKFTGENLLDKSKKTLFDYLYLHSMLSSLLAFAIAIPFFMIERSSLPLTVGVLTCLAWFPLSYLIKHWVGYFNSIVRTLLIVAAWYLFPEQRYQAVSLVIVVMYAIAILALELRWRKLHANIA